MQIFVKTLTGKTITLEVWKDNIDHGLLSWIFVIYIEHVFLDGIQKHYFITFNLDDDSRWRAWIHSLNDVKWGICLKGLTHFKKIISTTSELKIMVDYVESYWQGTLLTNTSPWLFWLILCYQLMNFILYSQFPLRECVKSIFHGCY